MRLNWNFLGGGRVQNKKPSVVGGGGSMELHIVKRITVFFYICDGKCLP